MFSFDIASLGDAHLSEDETWLGTCTEGERGRRRVGERYGRTKKFRIKERERERERENIEESLNNTISNEIIFPNSTFIDCLSRKIFLHSGSIYVLHDNVREIL